MLPRVGAALVRLLMVMTVLVLASPGRAAEPAGSAGVAAAERVDQAGRSCGLEADEDAVVLCGGAFLAGLVAPAHLLMDRTTCSRLLEELFSQQMCSPAEGDCGQLRGAPAAPAGPRVLAGATAAARLPLQDFVGRDSADRTLARADRDAVPRSRRARPPTPPPRA